MENDWAVLSDEQTSKGWPFSLLNDEQMSNKVRVEHQPDEQFASFIQCQAAGVLDHKDTGEHANCF